MRKKLSILKINRFMMVEYQINSIFYDLVICLESVLKYYI